MPLPDLMVGQINELLSLV